MSVERLPELPPRMLAAIDELEALLRQRYPDVVVRVTRSPENPETILLKPVVDVDDLDEVMDVVIDRLVELTSTEGLPLMVVPVRTPARNAAIRQMLKATTPSWRR